MEGTVSLFTYIANALSAILEWVGTVITALFTSGGELAPLLEFVAIGLGLSLVLYAIRIIKGLVWGV